jgi:hypothetical protein
MTGPPPGAESQVSVGKPEPDAGGFGKEMGSLPEGTFAPKIVVAGAEQGGKSRIVIKLNSNAANDCCATATAAPAARRTDGVAALLAREQLKEDGTDRAGPRHVAGTWAARDDDRVGVCGTKGGGHGILPAQEEEVSTVCSG